MNQSQNDFFVIDQRYYYRKFWFICGCIQTMAIIYFSLSSPPPMPDVDQIDKVFHVICYMVLMLWWAQLYPHFLMRVILTVALILMGAGIEVAQSFHPLRYFDLADMLANGVGVLIGLGFAFTLLGKLLIKVDRVLARRFMEE